MVQSLRAQYPNIANDLTNADRREVARAARNNETTAVRLLLESGLPPDPGIQHQATPLHWAAFHGNVTMAKLLLARNPPLEAEDADFHSTPLGWAIHGSENGWHCRTGDYAATAEALIVAGAKVPEKTEGTEAVREVLRKNRPNESNSQHSPA
jgi:ankyrin repeat protein